MKHRIKYSFVLIVFLLFSGVAMPQQGEIGGEGKPAAAEEIRRSSRALDVLPDGDQPVIAERNSEPLPEGAASDEAAQQAPEVPVTHMPLWRELAALSFSEKENAVIQLEVTQNLQMELLTQVAEIEKLWNTGEFDQAIARLRNSEESEGLRDIAVGISWRLPRMAFGAKWGTDVPAGTRQQIAAPCLDFHDATGNLFAVLRRRGGDNPRFTVNISTDGGQTWQETYAWSGGNYELIDLDAAVVADYLYVGYIHSEFPDQARIRRFFASTGSVDAAYFWQEIFDRDVNIKEMALTTSADAEGIDQIYHLAILTDGSLVYHYSGDGVEWYEIATGITNASRGLDAAYNLDPTAYFLFSSYIDSDDTLHLARRSAIFGWEDIVLDGNARSVTSVAAYQDRILVVYEYTDYDIKYRISYDGGNGWAFGWIAQSAEQPPYFHAPDVTGRLGGGFTVIYHQEVGGEPDSCWYRNRDYGTGPATASWSNPKYFNEVDVFTGRPMAVERIPPFDPACHAYGSIWIGGGVAQAYFDRTDHLPGDANGDGAVAPTDVVSMLNYLFRNDASPEPLWTGDANCDGSVDPADVVYLLSYLFRGGPPPCCP